MTHHVECVETTSPRPRALECHFHRRDGDALIFTTITKGRAWPPPQRRQLALTGWLALEGAWYFGSDGEPQPAPHHLPHSMRHTCASPLVQRGVSLSFSLL
ncbi:hypothetical protein ACH4NS_17385 [Streptomyces mutabilis]|uniref:hypothetical protein n=1 Tax=Streptomyces TaxID=1883 RepID=UPI0035D63BB7